jgi:hypothetical protein
MTTDQATGYRPRRAPIPPQIDAADRPPPEELARLRRALRPERLRDRPVLVKVVSGERGAQ